MAMTLAPVLELVELPNIPLKIDVPAERTALPIIADVALIFYLSKSSASSKRPRIVAGTGVST